MKLLAIETASESCSVALALGDDVLERFELAPRLHAEKLLPWVAEILADAGVTLASLDAIAFSRGPGSFTSLRIGIGVVQGLAWGASLPVIPVSSLQATAQAIAHSGVQRAWVALDARMNEVFTARFEAVDGVMQPVGEERVCAPASAVERPLEGWTGVGNGFERYPELVACAAELREVQADAWPHASAVCQLARHWAQNHQPLPAEQAQPVYLRDQVAIKSGK